MVPAEFVTLVTNSAGTIDQKVIYTAWGEPTVTDAAGAPVATSQAATTFLFTAREFDPETTLYHYRARTYSPELGRFLQLDPIDFRAGDINCFRYVANGPLRSRDPFGLLEMNCTSADEEDDDDEEGDDTDEPDDDPTDDDNNDDGGGGGGDVLYLAPERIDKLKDVGDLMSYTGAIMGAVGAGMLLTGNPKGAPIAQAGLYVTGAGAGVSMGALLVKMYNDSKAPISPRSQ
jgi:RHS repeat-associated protein